MLSTGRIDIVATTSRYIYVIELKLRNNGGKEAAVRQIIDCRYGAFQGCLRGISEARFHGDLSGSDKHFSFALPACVENPAVHLCECAIDVMSYV